MAESPKIQWRATDSVVAQSLQERLLTVRRQTTKEPNLSDVSERDAKRYYYAVRSTLYALNLSFGEAMLIIDALNGSMLQEEIPQVIIADIEDAIDEGYATKWDVDGDTLIEKMRHWTPIDCLVVGDAVERWWANQTYAIEENQEQRCIRVGLIRAPRTELQPERGQE